MKDRAQEQTKSYEKSLPSTFGEIKSFNPQRNIKVHKNILRVVDDQLLRNCPMHVQAALRELYEGFDGESVSRVAVENLVKKIIPQAGFTGGCVFIIDPSTNSLKLRTVIGTVNLRSTYDIELDPRDKAVAALLKLEPIIELKDELSAEALAGIYRALGEQRKVGVLYLESPAADPEAFEERTMATFEAMRRALSDVLLLQ